MKWFLLVTVLGVATAQTLFFRPHHRRDKVKVKEEAVVCPGNKSACPTGNTCCLISAQAYGCCGLPNAVCCLDKKHCCPFGTKCDIEKGNCQRGNIAVPWQQKTSVIQLNEDVIVGNGDNSVSSAVICPDGQHECQDGSSCCKSESGYACCQYKDAVCCSDEIHCCPKGTECDLTHSKCVGEDRVADMAVKQMAVWQQTQSKQTSDLKTVICPDGKSQCEDGQTCCQLASGAYGCCPLPKAVCCSDHIHCCPTDTTCDVSQGKCVRGQSQVEWFVKSPARQLGSVVCPGGQYECPDGTTCCKMTSGQWACCPLPQVDWFVKSPARQLGNVVCPGGQYECPDGTTCCKLKSGQWACCPLPQAVCCSDHIHCCPSDTTCDVSQGKCIRGQFQIDWFVKAPARQLGNVVCPDQSQCPEGNTCCKMVSGKYGCCPLPRAVCCSDHIHCCPSDTTCDVSQGKCIRGQTQVDWFVKSPARQLGNVVCPGGQYECPDGTTCCKLKSGQWACCPLPQAVCCSDHIHCCPSDTTCDVSQGKCIRGQFQIDWFVKAPARQLGNVVCPDQSQCPEDNTCCKMVSGKYGCCPLPRAVCCSDHIHCCPSDTTCDVSQGKCIRGQTQVDWFVKSPARQLGNVVCPGGQYECPDGTTCCKLKSGQWACCPLPQAVCCSDHIHCCPSDTTCDVSQGKCIRGQFQIDWFVKAPARQLGNVVCPDQSQCPEDNTCCKMVSGKYGCCPLPRAVCCSDHIHCCPSDTTCDVSQGKCIRGQTQVDWFVKSPARQLGNVVCPGGQYECPDGTTCCKLKSGQWACCPLPQAVCCSDHIHCCPSDTTCDVSQGKCIRGQFQIDWFVKAPARQLGNVVCPDQSQCPEDNTCCKMVSGKYGCCPLPRAVCCSDHIHCCPSDTTCDVSQGKCIRGQTQVDWFVKSPARQLGNVVCPGGQYECPDGTTCCKLKSGQWACCPLPQAVCCSDHIHCCPSDTTCDVSQGKCIRGQFQIDWFVKAPARQLGNVVCPDQSQCPEGNTCCKMVSGKYGCCPLPRAVCCSDHIHCCPSDTTCDVSQGKCIRGQTQVDWFVKSPARQLGNVVCPGGQYECPDGTTCCKLKSGQWACCPLPQAVCCSDHIHCCPSDTTCDVSQGKCIRGQFQIDWFVKAPARQLGNVVCPDQSQCPEGNTCCKMVSGKYGCCPLPRAVCCSDHVHCCPSDTTCDVSQGKCIRGQTQVDWFVKSPARQLGNVVCPGGQYECPDGTTCCKLKSGQWACCPLPQAECCSDEMHCCPQGTTCSSTGKCYRDGILTDWFTKIPATVRSDVRPVQEVTCKDGSMCQDGETCCLMASGKYGCCPCVEAVCCPDGIHCCPHGYVCNMERKDCEKAGWVEFPWINMLKHRKIEGLIPVKKSEAIPCPGGKMSCSAEQTCCDDGSGGYKCCPLPMKLMRISETSDPE